jgi:hypothetical protein
MDFNKKTGGSDQWIESFKKGGEKKGGNTERKKRKGRNKEEKKERGEIERQRGKSEDT